MFSFSIKNIVIKQQQQKMSIFKWTSDRSVSNTVETDEKKFIIEIWYDLNKKDFFLNKPVLISI